MNSFFQMRPSFVQQSQHTPEVFQQRVRDRLKEAPESLTGTVTQGFIILRPGRELRHTWSPQLTLDVEADAQGSRIRGLFMPAPTVWTFFLLLYAVIAFAGFCGTIYGLAQWQLKQTPLFLWSFPVSLLLLLAVHSAAHIGQRLGDAQMKELKKELDHCL